MSAATSERHHLAITREMNQTRCKMKNGVESRTTTTATAANNASAASEREATQRLNCVVARRCKITFANAKRKATKTANKHGLCTPYRRELCEMHFYYIHSFRPERGRQCNCTRLWHEQRDEKWCAWIQHTPHDMEIKGNEKETSPARTRPTNIMCALCIRTQFSLKRVKLTRRQWHHTRNLTCFSIFRYFFLFLSLVFRIFYFFSPRPNMAVGHFTCAQSHLPWTKLFFDSLFFFLLSHVSTVSPESNWQIAFSTFAALQCFHTKFSSKVSVQWHLPTPPDQQPYI